MKRLAKISLTLGLGASLVLITGNSFTFAQTAADLEGVGTYPANERDSFSGGTDLNPFDLIHNARLGNRPSLEEFNQQSQENLDDAAAEFKRQQQELLLNPQSQSNSNSTTSTTEQE